MTKETEGPEMAESAAWEDCADVSCLAELANGAEEVKFPTVVEGIKSS
jgi:hypothetical protein